MRINEYSLATLFSSRIVLDNEESIKIERIVIPRIQRDYAQGRRTSDVIKIRDRFLASLYEAIAASAPLALDFIYGDITDGVLIPLDGQQRLTTLILLHWYASRRETQIKSIKDDARFLERFSYETRISSRRFYESLCEFWPDEMTSPVSSQIIDQNWFQLHWCDDPTVDSMLIMLDAIQSRFSNVKDLWGRLVNQNLITFYFKALKDLGVTDEIYIKMNSRGKPLTPFEHFKAEFGTIVETCAPDIKVRIEQKIDVAWARMLFRYRGADNTIDEEFMRYYRYVCNILCFKMNYPEEQDEFMLAVLLFGNKSPKAKENLLYLESMFDCWCSTDAASFFDSVFSKKTYEEGKVQIYQDDVNLFRECCEKFSIVEKGRRPFSLASSILLYAVTEFLRSDKDKSKDSNDFKDFCKRIRIIRNLVWNSSDEIRVRDEAMRILLNETDAIINQGIVPGLDMEEQGYNGSQKREEINKLEWGKTHPADYQTICKLEDHKLLQGCIAILGLDNIQLTDRFYRVFDFCSYDLVGKTLLVFGDYSQTIDRRVQFGCSLDSAWRDLFHPSRKRLGFEKTSLCLIALLSMYDEPEFFTPDALQSFVASYLLRSDTLKDWRYYMIKYDAMRIGYYGRYCWRGSREENPYCIIMMNTSERLSGTNWEVFSKTLAERNREELSLGNDAKTDLLTVKGKDVNFDMGQSTFTVRMVGYEPRVFDVPQEGGIDTKDRIEWAEEIINSYL